MEINEIPSSTVIQALSALAQGTRLSLFRLLIQQGTNGLPAGQIGKQLGIPAATLSFHLSQLQQAQLIEARREGRSIIYSASYPAMQSLINYLTENCCGHQQTASPCCHT